MSIKVGSILSGTVENITDFGAFVTLPEGGSGLLHISQVSKDYVSNLKDYLKKGQEVTVKVISVDEQKNKVGLSMIGIEGESVTVIAAQTKKPSFKNNKGGRNDRTPKKQTFDEMVDKYLRDSYETQKQLRKSTEKKQNGGKRKVKPVKSNRDDD